MRSFIFGILIACFCFPALADHHFKDAAKEKAKEEIKEQILDPLREKVDKIIQTKEKIDAGKQKVADLKQAIKDAMLELQARWNAFKQEIIDEIKQAGKDKAAEKIAERGAEMQARIDCIRECLEKLAAIRDSVEEIKNWVDAAPDLPQGWHFVIFRETEDGLKVVVERPAPVQQPEIRYFIPTRRRR